MDKGLIKDWVERILRDVDEIESDDSFSQGRLLAFYESLTSLKNTLETHYPDDMAAFGLDFDLDKRLLSKEVVNMTEAEVYRRLDDAMYTGKTLSITTKERGIIVGTPYSVDELETDENRMGYCIEVEPHLIDTVFFDEVVAIDEIKFTVSVTADDGNVCATVKAHKSEQF